MSYCSLHVHSDYSNIRMLDSINQLPLIFERARELRLNGLAITDHESLSGHIKAIQYVNGKRAKIKEKFDKEENETKKELIKQELDYWNNFKLILGNEIYLTRNGLTKDNYIKGQDKYYHFILLAKDAEGHKQLRRLSSSAWSHSFRQFIERVPTYKSDIERVVGANPGHIIASTACLGSEFANLIMKYLQNGHSNVKEIDSFVEWCISIFGKDNFYIELQASPSEDQEMYNACALAYAKARGLKAIITTDAHYLRKEDRPIHKSYLNAGEGDREVDEFYSGTYLMDSMEIKSYMTKNIKEEDIDWMLDNTNYIGTQIEEYSLAHKPIIPRVDVGTIREYNIPEEVLNKPYLMKFYHSEDEQDKKLFSLILEGMENKFKKEDIDRLDLWGRLEMEAEELWELSEKIEDKLSAYLITVRQLIRIIWKDGDSLVGPSRGSAMGFLMNYLIDITQIAPVDKGVEMFHWRFINKDRASMMDIDIDTQGNKREKIMKALKDKFGEYKAINVATFKTEKSKSAIQTACRGLGYDSDIGLYLSSMVPTERGIIWSLHDCYYGDEENGRKPIQQFKTLMDTDYSDVWEVAQKIEGTICGRGSHAGGVIVMNYEPCDYNALMKAPNGQITTQYELYDTEYMGGIKYDLLSVEALDKIRTCMDLLLKDGLIDWQGSLFETYAKYLHPDVLDYTSEEMWRMADEGQVISLFQFETPVGGAAIKLTKPTNILELAVINSLMRLMPEGSEMPVNTYYRFKQDNMKSWYQEMKNHKLTEEEIEIMEKHLLTLGGVADSQEAMMLLVMNEKIANFSRKEADKLRKAVAKKKPEAFLELEQLFYKKAKELGTSDNLAHYVWDVQVKRQRGYSFSLLHTYGYSTVAIQELNLAYKYPILYWNCANLIVDSAGIEEEDEFENLIDTFENPLEIQEEENEVMDEEDDDTEEIIENGKKKKVKVVNYGKISAAIGKMISRGIQVDLPNINKSLFTFAPDVDNNAILFGIKGISRINNDLAKEIISRRPYKSMEDFLQRVKINKISMINLIKAGCFDKLENARREDVMRHYIDIISDKKQRLTLQNMQMLIKNNCIPSEFKNEVHVYNFNKYLKGFKDLNNYVLDERALNFYEKKYDMDLVEQNEKGNFIIKQSVWDKIYKKEMEGIKEELKTNLTILENLNNKLFEEMWNKYASGTISKWEMDSVCFYYHKHELAQIDKKRYRISNFYDLSEEPIIESTWKPKDRDGNVTKEIPLFKLTRICGTVIDKDKNKNLVTLLTDDGVVGVKIYRAQFSKYDKQISVKDEVTGKKTIVERSWFRRGNKLMVSGIRRGDNFVPKVYKKSEFEFPIELITSINDEGEIEVAGERVG